MPFLLSSGMGADLQKPLALAVIGGMLVGTVVSVYLIPVMYFGLVKGIEMSRLKEYHKCKKLRAVIKKRNKNLF